MKDNNGANRVPQFWCPNRRRTSVLIGHLGVKVSVDVLQTSARAGVRTSVKDGDSPGHITRLQSPGAQVSGSDTTAYASQSQFQQLKFHRRFC
jgi:hypothetical protein